MSYGRYLALLLLAAQSPAADYVDAKLCAACHPQIARTYALTGMARSFYAPTGELGGGDPFHHELSDTWYAMSRRDGNVYQRRWRIGPDGQPVQVEESRVDYVMGSGNHARSFLTRTTRGALIELPLAWYAENGGGWAMAPGRDREYFLALRQVAYECMFCHNAYPSIPVNHDEPGSEPLYTGALPEGIDCQRCHGPGSSHVRAAQQGAGAAAIRAAIVNPARLSAERQMEVCLQCHLETTSRPLPHSIVRYGRAPFSYRPGEPLGEFEIFFDRAAASPRDDDFEIAHSAYRFRQSQCFLRGAGKLTCTTCHNPHDMPRGAAATRQYDNVCGQCHAAAVRTAISAGKHTAAADCVACHMPKRRTGDVVHAVMTDHFIQRRPPPGDLLAPLRERPDYDANQYRGEVVPYYPVEKSLYEAVAQVSQGSNPAAGLPRLSAEISRQDPAEAAFYVELGEAWLSGGKPAEAAAALEEAAKRKPASAVVLLNLGDALTQAGQAARAVTVLQRALQSAPADALLWYQLAIAQAAGEHGEQALTALEKSTALDPDFAEAHNLFGATLAGAGDLDRAEKELLAALRIDPDLPEALGNYAHLLAARHDLPKAIYYFARAVRLKPNDADVRTNYAVALAGLNRFAEAAQQIEAALKADPNSPDAHHFQGALLDRQGLRAEALAQYLEAIRLRPDFALAHLDAARVLAAQGDLPAAERHLRQAEASGDPGVASRAAALLKQIGHP